MIKKVVGILNMYGEPSLGPLTANRTLGSTSFLGRFAVMDFALSNFTNSGIDEINILVKNNFRSVAKHVGNLKSWVTNTKIGRQNILINERGINDASYNTDLACISENDWILYEAKADIVIITSSYVLATIDFKKAVDEHIASGKEISVIYSKIHDGDKTFKKGMVLSFDDDGNITKCVPNDQTRKHINVSLNSYIVNIATMREMIKKYVKNVEKPLTFKEALQSLPDIGVSINPIEYHGYCRMFDSLKSFMKISFELLDYRNAKRVFDDDWPIYTLSHDTIPSSYASEATVANSFIANGANIYGHVENSIISRRVRISKGAVIKNSIILTATFIGENAIIENALIDKYAHISAGSVIKGTKAKPIYVEQGKKTR